MARQYYKDSTTGQMKPLGVKVEDTLPVGTEVDYDGTDIPEGWVEVSGTIPKAYELFSSDNGANSGTLSDNYTNYERIEIVAFTGSTNPFFFTQILYPAKTNRAELYFTQSDISSDSDNKTYYKTARFSFSTNTFSRITSASWYERKATGVPTGITYDNDDVKIYKIIGYKN